MLPAPPAWRIPSVEREGEGERVITMLVGEGLYELFAVSSGQAEDNIPLEVLL